MAEDINKLNEAIEKTKAKIFLKQKEHRQAEIRERGEKKEFWENEQKYLDEKLELAEEIFEWCEEFSESKYFRELVEIDSKEVDVRLSGSERGTLWIYSGGWGHKKEDFRQHYSRLSLCSNGKLIYQPVVVGIGGGGPAGKKIEFDQALDMAEKLTKDYLEKLHNYIQSGEIYRTFIKNLMEIDS